MSGRFQPHYADNRGAMLHNRAGYVQMAEGTVVPVNGSSGYATACIFCKTNGGVGTSIYINQGSVTSSLFSAVTPAMAGDAQLALKEHGLGPEDEPEEPEEDEPDPDKPPPPPPQGPIRPALEDDKRRRRGR